MTSLTTTMTYKSNDHHSHTGRHHWLHSLDDGHDDGGGQAAVSISRLEKKMDTPISVIVGSISMVAAIAATILASLGAISVMLTLRSMQYTTYEQVDEYLRSNTVDSIIRHRIDSIIGDRELSDMDPIQP